MSMEYRPREVSKIGTEVAVDPHMLDVYHSQVEDVDIQDHRQVYVGVHIPLRPRKHHHQKHHHRRRRRPNGSIEFKSDDSDNQSSSLPTDKVRFILGGEENDESHKMFTQLAHYQSENEEWRQMARWLKFEEAVEEGGDRWSKPHVGTLSLYSLFELRSSLLRGTVLLDMNATNVTQISDLVLDDMVNKNHLDQDCRQKAREVLLKKHRHQCKTKSSKKGKTSIGSFGSFAKKASTAGLSEMLKRSDSTPKSAEQQKLEVVNEVDQKGEFPHLPSAVDLVGKQKDSNAKEEIEMSNSEVCVEYDNNFMKKIPPGAQASNVLVGELDFLKKPVTAFVRLENACVLGNITEVPVPTRFIFLMLGPPGTPGRYHEVGRAIATLMSDEVFHEVAYKAQCREDLLAGIDEFLMQVTVLPPGEWDPSIRIEPPDAVPSQDKRLESAKSGGGGGGEEHDPAGDREEQLAKTGRLCGGLIADMKRRAPWYWSDFKDALNPQCIASIIFIYFACLTPIITFGGVMGTKTGKNMAAMEQILAGGIGGVLFSLFGGQPLIILGATGPMLVFEEILYTFCENFGIDYLPFRLWIGIWTMLYCFILVITDASAFVRYFTRFTEESFATLIALIFIVEGFKKLVHVLHDSPVKVGDANGYIDWNACQCVPKDMVDNFTRFNSNTSFYLDYPLGDCERYGGHLVGQACHNNVFFLSVILSLGTFALALSLKGFRTSPYFPTKVRAVVSDFAILISIMVMVGVDVAFGVNTPKLDIPLKFQPTASEKRGWIIPPLGKNPVWTIPAAAIPALLATILVFMDQQITALIVNRREHKLKKGAGYHLDLLLVAIIIGICSLLGLPWVVAATVLSVGHVQSLFVESQCTAPGEKTQFLGVREQRVTGTFIFILIGLTVFIAPILKYLPMPVLFGLFFYMGFSALKGLQFFERLKIIFMPVKHQPDLMYLRQVPLNRIHIFTFIQLFCLAVLWAIKSTPAALIFPVMVLMLVAVRKVMEKIFTLYELEVLDDLMPENIKKQKAELEAKKKKEENFEYDDEDNDDDSDGKKHTPGKELNGSAHQSDTPMNISEEMCKTSLWKTFVKDGSTKRSPKRKSKSPDKHKHKHRHHHKNKHGRHRRERDEQSEEDEGLWMLNKKDEGEDGEGSDAELHRKLSTINEDKPGDVIIDMEQIQNSLLEEAEENEEGKSEEKTCVDGDVEAKC
ncbi:electroneutral sodium bicarbonate exchanger 1-like isoform X1 [Acropora muricata]|uniref:electroneutral sodium bicarbonate exchanger 1-like isoform X1 n=2 Tax=Acropora millepora TaxID=45264 RepID=UPI001CF33E53|nr:electroneutral sodium bicarbonate exchanger 1-like isoform X1 [Acropora millepora]